MPEEKKNTATTGEPGTAYESFETAMERVEKIASQMENNELPLEDLIVLYEEGLKLVKFCTERLEVAEKRLQTISRNAAGQAVGLETVQTSGEIQSSTGQGTSVTEKGSTGSSGSASGPVRLF